MIKRSKQWDKIQVSIYIRESQLKEIDQEAKDHDLSRAKLLSKLIDKYYPESEKEVHKQNGTGHSIGNNSNGVSPNGIQYNRD